MKWLDRDNGFTLIELLCAIGFILIISVALFKYWPNYTNKIKSIQARTELYMLNNAIQNYKTTIGDYPDSANEPKNFYKILTGDNSKEKNFIYGYDWNIENNQLIDPWGNPYVFNLKKHTIQKPYKLLSTGPNGEQESEDEVKSGESDDVYLNK